MINNISIIGNDFSLTEGEVAIRISDTDYGPNITISKNIFNYDFSGVYNHIELYGLGSGVTIEKNFFFYSNNWAILFGGEIDSAVIRNNISINGGGDVVHFIADASNSVIANNTSRDFVNAIVCDGEFTAVDIINNIFVGWGTGIIVVTYTSGTLDYNDIYGFGVLYSISGGSVTNGVNSISKEPRFEPDTSFFHDVYSFGLLKSDSPCIDAGIGVDIFGSVPTDDFRDSARPVPIPGNWIKPALITNESLIPSPYSEYWQCVRMSPDGKYHVAISGEYFSFGYLHISSDYGKTFTRKKTQSVENDMYKEWTDVAISNNGSYMVAVSKDGIYLSTDKGVNWSNVLVGGIYYSVVISGDGQYITATGWVNSIFRSADYGSTWSEITGKNHCEDVVMDITAQYQCAVAANDFNRVWVSSDYGASWTSQHNSGEAEGYICECIAMSDDGTKRIIGCYGNILLSVDSGVNYSDISSLVAGSTAYRDVAMSFDGSKILVASDVGVYLSEDSGASFKCIFFGFPLTNIFKCAMSPNGRRMAFAKVYNYFDNLSYTYGEFYEYGVAVYDGTDMGAIECTAREVGLRPETYFVNASGSDTAPYDKPEKGATSFAKLFYENDGVPPYGNVVFFYENDIIEVIGGVEIDNTLFAVPNVLPDGIKIRSYCLNDSKPVVRINKNSVFFGACVFENIRFYKNGLDSGDYYYGQFIAVMPNSSNANDNRFGVKGCEFKCVNFHVGILIRASAIQVYFCKNAVIVNNVFIDNLGDCIYIAGGSYSPCPGAVIGNNVMYRPFRGGFILLGVMRFDNDGNASFGSLIFNNIFYFPPEDGVVDAGVQINSFPFPSVFSSEGGVDYNCVNIGIKTPCTVDSVKFDCPNSFIKDPKFFDAEAFDFRLLYDSPCVDAGVDGFVDIDSRGIWRPKLARSDIGAFEMIFEEFSVLGGKLIILENGRSYVRGDAKWCTDYFSPFAKEMISISGAKSQDDNGDFDIKYVTFDGKYSRVYLRNHEFSVNDDDVIVRFMDRKRDWVKISGDGSYAPGSMWEGDKIVIGTGGANDGEYVLSNIGFDVDGLPIAEIDRNAVATERVLCNELRPQKSTEYIAPKYNLIQMSRVTEYNSIGRYDDIITFDEEVDAPFVAITNRFLVRFLSLPNNELLTNALLDRMTRRIKLLSPIGSIFEGFAYRVSYENANKISLTQGQYDGAENMHVGVEMDGTISFDDGVDPKKIVGDGTLFKSQIVAGDSIIIGVDGGGYKIIMTVASVIDDVTLETADNLVGSTTGLKIAREMYQKRVVKYSESPSVEYPYTRYFIRSEIPSSESNDPVVWPKTDKMIVRACVSPDPFDHPYYVTPLTSKEVVPSFVKLDRMTIFFIFEVEIV